MKEILHDFSYYLFPESFSGMLTDLLPANKKYAI